MGGLWRSPGRGKPPRSPGRVGPRRGLAGGSKRDLQDSWGGFDPVWTTLGYDIADIFFVSGLSNCGVGSEEISRLRARWLEGVNGSGLLRSLARAREFKEYADQRFPSHAPFHILGLHCACA